MSPLPPNAIINFDYSGNPAATIRYNANQSKLARTVDCLHVGIAAGCKPRELVKLLAANHHNPSAVRAFLTAVLSVQTPRNASPEVLADFDNRLEQAIRDLSRKLGVPILGWIHKNTRTRHAHLLIPNSDNRRTLQLTRKVLKQLQGFEWTTALASGRGKGQRKALPVYPHARQLDVRDLAQLLLDESGEVRDTVWDHLAAVGAISNVRARKDGSPISFEFRSRRIRFETLKGFLTVEKKGIDMTNTSTYQQAPPELQQQLGQLGLSPEAIGRILGEFSTARELTQRRERASQAKPQTQVRTQ